MVAVLLPLFFNPYAHLPIEAVKVILFQGITIGMLIVTVLSYLQKRIVKDGYHANNGDARNIIKKLMTDNPLLLPSLVFALVYLIATVFSIDPVGSLWGTVTRQGTLTILSVIVFFVLLVSGIRKSDQV